MSVEIETFTVSHCSEVNGVNPVTFRGYDLRDCCFRASLYADIASQVSLEVAHS
jgi:hypothetical protein